MTHRAITGRRRLLLAPALTIAVAAPLALASPAAACWCPPGMHESAPGSDTCVPDTPAPQTVKPPKTETPPTTETPAPPTTETPAPAPETPAAPAPAPAPVVATPAPAPAPAPAVPVVESATPAAPVAAEEEQGAVLGEQVSSKPSKKQAAKAAAPETAPVVETAAAPGQLPFTGLDTGLIAIMGAGLLGTGVVLRRRTQPDA